MNASEKKVTETPQSSGMEWSETGNPPSAIRHPQYGRYLYGVADWGEQTSLGRIGIEGHEVYTIPYQNLCAVVHNCPAQPYHSEDDDVVTGWVITHHHVVNVAWERFGTILPAGFDTIIKSDEGGDPQEQMRVWLKQEYEASSKRSSGFEAKPNMASKSFGTGKSSPGCSWNRVRNSRR